MMYLFIVIGVIVLILIMKLFGSKGKSETIGEAEEDIKQLIESGSDGHGFIVLHGASKDMFLQFAKEKNGLILICPTESFGNKYASQIVQELQTLGYADENIQQSEADSSYPNYKGMTQDKDFIYANVGHDSKEIIELVKLLFRKVYDYTDFDKINVQLAVNG